MTQDTGLVKALTTKDIFAAGVGLVVAASTLVSDLNGWFAAGRVAALAFIAMFILNMFLGLSAAELATTYPKAGALYDYGAAATPGGEGFKALIGLFLGFVFYGMFAFAGGGETAAGASGAIGLFNGGSLTFWIIVLTILSVIPNLFGISILAKIEIYTLVAMLGIRWFFGLAGFAGFSQLGGWSLADIPAGDLSVTGIIGAAGAFAFWSFVGIEFVAPLAEETRDPARQIPRGIIYGLIAILATSLFMGFGITGLDSDWASKVDPSAPQLGVGEAMFGSFGRILMALGSVLATYTSMTIVYAAMPRILYGMSRNGHFFGPISKWMGRIHPRYRTPWVATLVTAIFYTYAAISFGTVIEQIFTAAYVWILLYAVYHVLVVVSRYANPGVERPFRLQIWVPIVGFALTIFLFWKAFEGAHSLFGPRALWIIGLSLGAAILCIALQGTSGIDSKLEEEVRQEV